MTKFLAAIPVVVVLIAGVVFAVSLFKPEDALRDPAVGRDFPLLELEPVADRPLFNPAEHGVEGPALVNVWASWCTPCVAEHPMLMGLSQDGVTIYGVDWKERAEGAGEAFLQRHGSPFTAVGADQGPAGVELGITGVPETFVVDTQGRIIARHAGPLDPEVIQNTIRPALERAAEAPAAPEPAG